MCTVKRLTPCANSSGPGLLPLRNDHDRRGADGEARVLVRRASDAARHHEPDMDPVTHAVGVDDVEQPRLQLRPADADVDAKHFSAIPKTIEVTGEKCDPPVDKPQSL